MTTKLVDSIWIS